MKSKQFIKECQRTKSGMRNFPDPDLVHAAMGLATESGEFLDNIKKHMFYNKPLDRTNLKEELGDILWYAAIAMSVLDTDFNKEMDRVIGKLKLRYPEKFSEENAINRDLESEQKYLENFK